MAEAVVFNPENRLAKIIDQAAPTSEALVHSAEGRVDGLRDGLREFVRQQIEALLELAKAPPEALLADGRALGDRALMICEVAGSAGWPEIGQAARGIYELIEALVSRGVWHADALMVHVNAIALLNAHSDLPPEMAAQVVERLKAVRDHLSEAA